MSILTRQSKNYILLTVSVLWSYFCSLHFMRWVISFIHSASQSFQSYHLPHEYQVHGNMNWKSKHAVVAQVPEPSKYNTGWEVLWWVQLGFLSDSPTDIWARQVFLCVGVVLCVGRYVAAFLAPTPLDASSTLPPDWDTIHSQISSQGRSKSASTWEPLGLMKDALASCEKWCLSWDLLDEQESANWRESVKERVCTWIPEAIS